MEQAWLVTNAFLRAESFRRMEEELLSAARRAGVRLKPVKNDAFVGPASLGDPPACALFFDKDVRLAQRMEAAGVRLFNSSRAIAACDDKTATTLLLERAGLPQPETLLCPKSYEGVGYGGMDFLNEVAGRLGFPLVVKEGQGSFGRQVYLAESMGQLRGILENAGDKPLLFQRFVRETAGRDLRIYVVGGRSVASMERVNRSGDFRANLEHGGVAIAYRPSPEEAALAVAACLACGADFAGVDLLPSKAGPLVCEVNSNAHFLGLMQATGVNPADDIVRLLKVRP